jgi:hypothetical protein
MVTHLVDHNALTLLEIGLHTGHYHGVALHSKPKESKNGYGDENSNRHFTKDLHWQALILS